MTWAEASDIILDSLIDSALVFIFVFLIHFLLSFFENRIANFLIKRKKTGPLFGSLFGLIPQCGTSVLGADLYTKKYITMGVIVSVFLSCSDEAFIKLLTSGNPSKMIMVLPLIGLKFVIGFVIGYLTDLIFRKQNLTKIEHIEHQEKCEHHHTHNSPIHEHLIHPLLHSLEIFAYVLVINLALGFIIGFVGEEAFINFLSTNGTPSYGHPYKYAQVLNKRLINSDIKLNGWVIVDFCSEKLAYRIYSENFR